MMAEGHLISKCLFGVLNFFQKKTSHSFKDDFIRSFFGRICRHQKDISKLSDLYKQSCFETPSILNCPFLYLLQYKLGLDIDPVPNNNRATHACFELGTLNF